MNIVAFHAIQIPLLKNLFHFWQALYRDRFAERGNPFLTPSPKLHNTDLCRLSVCTLTKSFPLRWHFLLGKNTPQDQSTDNTGRWRIPGECWAHLPIPDHDRWPLQSADPSKEQWFGFNYLSEFTMPEAATQDMYVASFWSRYVFLRWITADPSPLGNFTPPKTTDHMYVASFWSR